MSKPDSNSAFCLLPSAFQRRGFVIAAAGSSSGKTTASLAILSYLSSKGIKVAPFKVGPDFIDPGHHTKVSGRTSYNLDSWMLSKAYNRRLFFEKTKNADIAVVEGVMGLFDGYDGLSEAGSTAQMAKWLGLPVILIVSAKGMARSAAAIVKGFETFDPNLNIAGVIFTKVGSPRHYDYLKKAVEQSCRAKVLGYMPKNDKIRMPERHLGLVTADELTVSEEVLSILRSMVADSIDMDALIRCLEPVDMTPAPAPEMQKVSDHPVIAVARDKAFCFYYPDNLEILEKYGAKIVAFSPLNNDPLPDQTSGIYFGGGYPELYAEELSRNTSLLKQVKMLSQKGMPIYGECGGFMYLCGRLSGMDSERRFDMTGCFDFDVTMSSRLRSLGYRQVTLKQDTVIGKKGDVIRGHEFHYSSLDNPQHEGGGVYDVQSRAGQKITLQGFQTGNTLGSYLHVHFGSNENCAAEFVRACSAYQKEYLK